MAKKKTYRLQIVLDQKEEARDQAALYLTEKREALKREQEEEARLQGELKSNRERKISEYDTMIRDGLAGGLGANSAQGRLNFIKRLDHQAELLEQKIEEQKKRIKRAEEEVEEALQALIQASRELQVMKKHKEKWQIKIKRDEEIKEQREMNEIGNVMYTANKMNRYPRPDDQGN